MPTVVGARFCLNSGDQQTNGRRYTNTNLTWKIDTPLLKSGLLGPVVLFQA